MPRKRETFGLSLLDVLSNALVGGIVLMLIASVFTKVLGELQQNDDPLEGESKLRSDPKFKPVENKLKSALVLNLAVTVFGDHADSVVIDCRPAENDPGEFQRTCIRRWRGLYDSGDTAVWLFSNLCGMRQSEWIIYAKLRPGASMDSVQLHGNAGVTPIPLSSDRTLQISSKATGQVDLWRINEIDSMSVPDITSAL